MSFVTVKPVKYVNLKETKPGTVIVNNGTYLKKFSGGMGPYGERFSYHFRLDNEDVVGVPASGQLNWLIENNLSVGQRAMLTYNGKKQVMNKKKGVMENNHDYELAVDSTFTPSAVPVAAVAHSASESIDISL
jgi:hypothetical protein